MTKEEITIEKFHTCTGVQRHIIKKWLSTEEPNTLNYGIDVRKAKQIIEDYKMGEYSKLLLYFMEFKRGQFDTVQRKFEYGLEESKEEFEQKLELINLLEKALSRGKITSVQFNKATDYARIKNENLIKSFINSTKAKFKKQKYHITSLTIEEAKQIYENQTNKVWFDEWKQGIELCDEEGNFVTFDEIQENKIYYDTDYHEMCDSKFIYQDMFYNYGISHPVVREINLQLILQLKLELEEEKNQKSNKAGNREMNRIIALVAFALADLMRIDDFLSQNKEMDKITISNEAGWFILKFMVCFGLIKDKTDKKDNPRTHKFTKDLIRNKKNAATPDYQLNLRSQRLKKLKSILSDSTGGVI